MSSSAEATTTFIGFAQLQSLLAGIFETAGATPEVAAIIAENCAMCERDGSHSHGVFRVTGYVNSLRSGWVDGGARPVVEQRTGTLFAVDAGNGFAQPALRSASGPALQAARQHGMAIISIRNSHHFSALWPDIEPFATEDLIGLTMVTGAANVIPHGGHAPVYGTDPIAFAAPVEGRRPVVFDQATSAMSHGDLRIAAREGRMVPEGTGVTASGESTTRPEEILNGGGLLPFGGHKGSAIAFMVEVLASALSGGAFAAEVDFAGFAGAETPRTGQFVLLIDPAHTVSRETFKRRVAGLIQHLAAAGQVRQPADRRYRLRDEAADKGIPLPRHVLEHLRRLEVGAV